MCICVGIHKSEEHNGSTSALFSVGSSVRQGSCLSPVIFNMFVNMFITGRKAGIKITFVSLFWFHRPVGATLRTDYRQIWHG